MSSIGRKNKRRAAFKCAKQGIAPAQAIAVSAAREIQTTKAATTETMEVLLQAMALVAAHDYGKLDHRRLISEFHAVLQCVISQNDIAVQRIPISVVASGPAR